jgi:CMP/dCMP kinase
VSHDASPGATVARDVDRGDGRRAFAGVVAIDGPSGTGKSTVARRLAAALGLRYLDTGAMYRAATLAVLQAGVDPADALRVVPVVAGVTIEVDTDPHHAGVRFDGRDVSRVIRGADVTASVSAVSAVPGVRQLLVRQQRRIIGSGGIVVEGRDIGSVVWPHAQVKAFLTASSSERARRRANELGRHDAISAVEADLQSRDRRDSSRRVGPLVRASDAVEIDTTALGVDEVVDKLAALARQSGRDETDA